MLRRTLSKQLGFCSRVAVSSPHPAKTATQGEDAFCISSKLLAVADGVSTWAGNMNPTRSNSGEYARHLTRSLHTLAEDSTYENIPLDARAALGLACTDANAACQGSSTVIMTSLEQNRLTLLNLGDCCGMIVRGIQNGVPEVIHRSTEMQHTFSFPYRLGRSSVNTPGDATVCHMTVQEGDVVILGSDGVFDNVFDADVLEVVSHYMQCAAGGSDAELDRSLHRAAAQIVRHARAATRGAAVKTPIQDRAASQGMILEAGQLDDATILIGAIGRDETDSVRNIPTTPQITVPITELYASASYVTASM